MKQLGAILAILCCFSFTSLNVYAQLEDAKEWIEEAGSKMETAMIEGDYEYLTSLYSDDVISLPSYEPMVKGKENVVNNMMKMMDSGFKFNTVDFEVVEVFGSGDYVYEIGTYKMNMSVQGMNEPIDDTGKYITIWEQTDDGYKIKAEIWNSNMNPWQDGGM